MTDRFDDKRINEALDLLNEMAKEKKTELQEMIHTKYSNLRSAVSGAAGKVQHDVAETYHHGKEKVKELASEVDESVRKNPWLYVGATAVGCLILGFLMGRSKKS